MEQVRIAGLFAFGIKTHDHAINNGIYRDITIWLTTGGVEYDIEWEIETKMPYYIYLKEVDVALFKIVFCIT